VCAKSNDDEATCVERTITNCFLFVYLQSWFYVRSGKHSKYQMNEKDYVFGAMSLYNDIISIFIYILKLLGEDKDE
jgi:FtsH-binding integral membrane protein